MRYNPLKIEKPALPRHFTTKYHSSTDPSHAFKTRHNHFSKVNSNQGLYPIRLAAFSGEDSQMTENDTTPQPICWCDRRYY